MGTAERLPPDGEEYDRYNSAGDSHRHSVEDHVRISADKGEPEERATEHEHPKAHEPLDGPARCQPSAYEIGREPEQRADREYGVIGSRVKPALGKDGFVEQRDARVNQPEH